MNNNDIITRSSPFSVKETADRLQAFLQTHGVTIYSRIDQLAEAARANIVLRPLEFLLFGNPQKGGVLMASNPLSALDLPLKIIIWQDAQNQTQLSYNKPLYITSRYDLSPELANLIELEPIITKSLQV